MKLLIRNIYKYNDGADKYCIYLGDSDNSDKIIVAEVATIDPIRKYIQISNLTGMVMYIDRVLYINHNSIISPLYINGMIVSITQLEFCELLKGICLNLLNEYKNNIFKLIDDNYDYTKNQIIDIYFSEKILRFMIWTCKKEELKFLPKNKLKYILKNNVYWAYLGCNIGSEIEKLRPVLVWKKSENMNDNNENSYFVFPISSKIPKQKYFYHVEIYINGQKNIVKINDGKRISIKRILKPMYDNNTNKTYRLEEQKIEEIKSAINRYFND